MTRESRGTTRRNSSETVERSGAGRREQVRGVSGLGEDVVVCVGPGRTPPRATSRDEAPPRGATSYASVPSVDPSLSFSPTLSLYPLGYS
jgi:hypothetical protein